MHINAHYGCPLKIQNTLQNYIWLLVQVQNSYVHLSWVADPPIKNNILYTQSWEVGDTKIYIFR
jgi:hypothetical protein